MQIRNDTDNDRYVVEIDGEVKAVAAYERRGDRVLFTHTEVDDSLGGQGVGSKLAAHALDDVRSRGERIVPLCPFIARYVERHPEYAELVDSEMLAEVRRG